MKRHTLGFSLFLFACIGSEVSADVCDFRLSSLAGSKAADAVISGGSATLAGPAVMQVAGLYFIPHSTSGALMLGSTLPGVSAAGTVGIIGGSGFAASALAILTAPLTLAVAGGTVVGVGALEAGCFYYVDEKIMAPKDVLNVLLEVDKTADDQLFKLFLVGAEAMRLTGERTRIRIPNAEGGFSFYYLENLYIVNGDLFHRDWLRNTRLGSVAAAVTDAP
jgi:hypothetical protein